MENKKVTHTTRLLLRLWNVGWFACIWLQYYNLYTFNTYRIRGGLVSIVVFFCLYSWLCSVYKAFRIASTNLGEIVFSQFISFAISDFVLYIECCLIYNQYVSFVPGLIIVFIQLAGTMVLCLTAKRYFMRHVPSQKTMILYGRAKSLGRAYAFRDRLLRKYAHLFDILYICPDTMEDDVFHQRMQGCSTLIMYGLDNASREKYSHYCLEEKKNFYFTPDVLTILDLGCEAKHLLDTPLMKYEYRYENLQKKAAKRILDIVLSSFFLILLSPLMLVTAAAIKLEDGGPVFFRQKRYTVKGRVFEILKFRSMIPDAEKNGVQPSVDCDPRITRVGRLIRASRMDEVPQFWNILVGDMSFVGPRPERLEHVDMYCRSLPEFRYRMSVKGGLTGYAQVFGKYNTSANDKLLLDLMYMENQSLLLDLKLILLTIRTVFQKESTEGFECGVSQDIQNKTGNKQ